VSVAAVDLVEVGGMPDGPAPAGESFLDPLVARLSAQYGLDPRAVGSLAVQVLASFSGARVRALVPVLVGKRPRGHVPRAQRPGTDLGGVRGVDGGRGMTAVARRRSP
jgi:hypothetical protein